MPGQALQDRIWSSCIRYSIVVGLALTALLFSSRAVLAVEQFMEGNPITGGSSQGFSGKRITDKFISSGDVSVSRIRARVGYSTGNTSWQYCIHSDSGGNPDTELGCSEIISTTGYTANNRYDLDFTFDPFVSLSNGVTYHALLKCGVETNGCVLQEANNVTYDFFGRYLWDSTWYNRSDWPQFEVYIDIPPTPTVTPEPTNTPTPTLEPSPTIGISPTATPSGQLGLQDEVGFQFLGQIISFVLGLTGYTVLASNLYKR